MSSPTKGKKRSREENGFRWFVQVAFDEMKKKFPEADEDYLVAGCLDECKQQWPSMTEHDRNRFYQCAEINGDSEGTPKKKKKTSAVKDRSEENIQTPERRTPAHSDNMLELVDSSPLLHNGGIKVVLATPDRHSESNKKLASSSTNDPTLRDDTHHKKKKKKSQNQEKHSQETLTSKKLNSSMINGEMETPQKHESKNKSLQNGEPKTPHKHNVSGKDDKDTQQKSKKKKRDPNLPKQGISAFFFYLGEHRENLKAANPDFKNTDIAQELGRRWKELSEVERKPYLNQQEEDKIRYNKEMAEYKQSLSAGGEEA